MLYTHSKRQTCIETGRHEIIQSVGHAFWGVGSQRYRTPSGLRGGRIICCPRVCPNGTRSVMFYSALTCERASRQTWIQSSMHACTQALPLTGWFQTGMQQTFSSWPHISAAPGFVPTALVAAPGFVPTALVQKSWFYNNLYLNM